MKDTVKLLLTGVLPLIAGAVLNFAILYIPIPFVLVNLLLTVLWGYLSYKVAVLGRNFMIQAVLLCLFGLLMLALALYQELLRGGYWMNILGFSTQMYFLPALALMSVLMSPFMEIIRPWPMYIGVWILLLLTSGIGCFIKSRKLCAESEMVNK